MGRRADQGGLSCEVGCPTPIRVYARPPTFQVDLQALPEDSRCPGGAPGEEPGFQGDARRGERAGGGRVVCDLGGYGDGAGRQRGDERDANVRGGDVGRTVEVPIVDDEVNEEEAKVTLTPSAPAIAVFTDEAENVGDDGDDGRRRPGAGGVVRGRRVCGGGGRLSGDGDGDGVVERGPGARGGDSADGDGGGERNRCGLLRGA